MVVTRKHAALNRALQEPGTSVAVDRAMASAFWSPKSGAPLAPVIDLRARRLASLRPVVDSAPSTEAAGRNRT